MSTSALPTWPAPRELVKLIPGMGVLGVWIALMPADGGYFPRDWTLAGVASAGLWLVAVIGLGRLLPPGRAARIAVCALLWLCGLAFLSALWADPPGTAFATAGQMLVVLLSVWTLALLPWREGSAQLLMAGFALGAAAAMGGSLVSAVGAEELGSHFIEDRWGEPIGYPNALGALGVLAMLPMLAVSASPERGVAAKAGTLALATALGGLALIPQSRGAVLSALLGAAILIALSPVRWRTAARVGVAGAALAAAAPTILAVFDAAEAGTGVGTALGDAARAVAIAAVAAGVAGLALAVLESRLHLQEAGRRRARLAGFAAVAALATGAVGAAAVKSQAIGDFVDRQRAAWTAETLVAPGTQETGTRLLSDDPLQRYLYWHVALDAFAEQPLAGVGAGGFEARYTLERKETKYAAYPHSLLLRVLAEGGLLALAGLLAFVAAVLWGLLARLRDASPGARTIAAAAIAAGAAFFTHAQLDWLEEFPVLAAPAAGFLLVALAAARPPAAHRAMSRPALAGTVAVGAAAALALALPYAAIRYRERAIEVWRAEPAAAYRDLDRAARLDPLDDLPHLTAGVIALHRREYARARRSFESALGREDGWLGRFELALAIAAEGDRGAAMRHLETARAQNPQEPAIAAAQQALRGGGAVDPIALNGRLFDSPLFTRRRLS